MDALLVVPLLARLEPLAFAVISMVGLVLSNVKVNGIELFEAVLSFPAASVNLFAGTEIEHSVLPLSPL